MNAHALGTSSTSAASRRAHAASDISDQFLGVPWRRLLIVDIDHADMDGRFAVC